MNRKKSGACIRAIIICYIICYIFRFIEYLVLRTDQSFIGEAFVHKLAGIAVLAFAINYLGYQWYDIGFKAPLFLAHILWGLLLGMGVYAVAYGVEYVILAAGGNQPEFAYYISSYSLEGNQMMQTSAVFLLICAAGNIINVIMEEGIFRGLFVMLAERRMRWLPAILLSSVLFGLWHVAAPVRAYLDGTMPLKTALIASLIQILFTGVMGIKLCLLTAVTGSVWTAMGDHFVNNFLVNILHVVTQAGADEMQMIRISIAQTLSFIIVLIWYAAGSRAISMKTRR